MRELRSRLVPFALALLVVLMTACCCLPGVAQASRHDWRLQADDYDEDDGSSDDSAYHETAGDSGDDEATDDDGDDQSYDDSGDDDPEDDSTDDDAASDSDDEASDDAGDDQGSDDSGDDDPADEDVMTNSEDGTSDDEETEDSSSDDAEVDPADAASSEADSEESDPDGSGLESDADLYVDEAFQGDSLADHSWAPPIRIDESDDAIPTETGDWGADEIYEVVEPADDGHWNEQVPRHVDAGDLPTGDLPVVHRVSRKPGSARGPGSAAGAKSRPAAPGASTGARKPGKPANAGANTRPPGQGASASAGQPDKPKMRSSFGGKPVANGGVPWQAQIYAPFPPDRWPAKSRTGKALWQLQHYCGGILIAPDWVLTAAHCIDQEMVDVGYRVRLGSRDISRDEGWTYKIDRIVRHSGYDLKLLPDNPNMYANDIALAHIVDDGKSKPRDPRRIQVIPLFAGKTLPPGTEVTGTGWGLSQSAENAQPNAVLLKVDLRVMDNAKCRSLAGYGDKKIGDGVFCAANPQRSTCRGDSGGPVILTNGKPTVVGVVSWGKKRCSGDGHPGVYTRIDRYRGWIEKAMKLPPTRNKLP